MSPKVLGVLAGEDMPREQMALWARSADWLLAADRGADPLLELGLIPRQVIGDFDSTRGRARLEQLAQEGKMELIHDPSQDTTDCDKLLALARTLGAGEITLAGFEGDQIDHMLATLHSGLRSELRVRLALRTGIGFLLRGGESVAVSVHPGRRVSLLPLLECSAVGLSGVRWPVAGRDMSPMGFGSISNRSTGLQVEARLGAGAALLYVEVLPEEVPRW